MGAFLITLPALKENENTIECVLDTLPAIHKLHLANVRKGKMKYDKGSNEVGENGDKDVLTEVHIYTTDLTNINTGPNNISLTAINKIEVIEKDRKKTTNSKLTGFIIGMAALATITGIVAALIDFDLSWGR